MKISWEISEADILQVKEMLKKHDNPFLKKRRERNIDRINLTIDQNSIVKTLIMCLLTSQQKAGPKSPVGLFLNLNPFPITIDIINQTSQLELFTKNILRQNGLNRFIERIPRFFVENISKIQNDNWDIITKLALLDGHQTIFLERKIADDLDNWLAGFGPKQSRNFLQSLGLTKYEIPIDSRITGWLNKFGFPVALTSSPLSDQGYYHFISDGIQILCERAGIYPCLLDAAIFSSFDNGEWTDENLVY